MKTEIKLSERIPNTGLEALDICNKDIYPNIYFLLKMLCTLPDITSVNIITRTYVFNSEKSENIFKKQNVWGLNLNSNILFNIFHSIPTFCDKDLI